jgi:hypothetical protein
MKGRNVLVAIAAFLAVAGCASAVPPPLNGIVGPVAWRAEEVGVVTIAVDGKEVDAYRFVLVMKETRGSTITFTRFETSVSDRDTIRGTPHVITGSWKLGPNGEWRIALPYTLTCLHMPGWCDTSRVATPLWQIRFSGRNDNGQEVDLPITVALPPASIRTSFR